MENIFSTPLSVNGKPVEYHVIFENERYVFSTEDTNANPRSFSFYREELHWRTDDDIDDFVKQQAAQQLEKYLLSQH